MAASVARADAAASATLTLPEIRRGVWPGTGGAPPQVACEIAAQPACSVRTLTQLVDRRFRLDFRAHLQFELERFVQAYELPEAREGKAAFFEKRAARWRVLPN